MKKANSELLWQTVEAHFQRRANALLEGGFDWLVRCYRFPFVLFEGGSVTVELSPEKTCDVLRRFRQRLLDDGVAEIAVALSGLVASQESRIKALTIWEFRTSKGHRIYSSAYHFFGAMDCHGTFIAEMLEYEATEPDGSGPPWGGAYLH